MAVREFQARKKSLTAFSASPLDRIKISVIITLSKRKGSVQMLTFIYALSVTPFEYNMLGEEVNNFSYLK
jgi:hypothetical protein